jgi:hypothetical protein
MLVLLLPNQPAQITCCQTHVPDCQLALTCLYCVEACAALQQQEDLLTITATLGQLQHIRLQTAAAEQKQHST